MNQFIRGEEVFVRGWIIETDQNRNGVCRVEMPGAPPSGPIIRRWISAADIIGIERIRPDDPECFSDDLTKGSVTQ